jgi:hypothetical protein|tara:strand:- start:762 stop:962 length:201 start_codon:yes stop_codon:yes gene_type:complete
MAKLIKELADLSYEGQLYVLSQMMDDYSPLELNGRVFLIPKEVSELINTLYIQVKQSKRRDTRKEQ